MKKKNSYEPLRAFDFVLRFDTDPEGKAALVVESFEVQLQEQTYDRCGKLTVKFRVMTDDEDGVAPDLKHLYHARSVTVELHDTNGEVVKSYQLLLRVVSINTAWSYTENTIAYTTAVYSILDF